MTSIEIEANNEKKNNGREEIFGAFIMDTFGLKVKCFKLKLKDFFIHCG